MWTVGVLVMDIKNIRCEKCGNLLRVDFSKGSKFRCSTVIKDRYGKVQNCGNVITYLPYEDIVQQPKKQLRIKRGFVGYFNKKRKLSIYG